MIYSPKNRSNIRIKFGFFFLKIKLHETNAFVIKKKVKEAIKTVRILIFSHGGSATERNY